MIRTLGREHFKQLVWWAVIDSLIILGAYTVAFSVRAVTVPLWNYLQLGIGFVAFVIAWTLPLCYLAGVYHRLWSRTSGYDVRVIVYALAVSTVVAVGVDLLGTPRPLPLSVVLLGQLLSLVGAVAVRYRSRLVSGFSWRWQAVWFHEFPSFTRVLIVGAGETGLALARQFRHWDTDTPYVVIGFVDDDPTRRGLYVEGVPILGTSEDIPRLAEARHVDLIAVAVHHMPGPAFRELLSRCQQTRARIKVVPDMASLMDANGRAPLLRDVRAEDLLGRKTIGRHEAVDFSPVTGRVVLVTGAAGSIGAELSRQLLDYDPVKLLLLDNNESGLHDLMGELRARQPDAPLVPILADVTIKAAVEKVFTQHEPEVVFHAAAYKHVPMLELFPGEAVRVNIGGTWLVAEMARLYHAERFVLISSDKAVNPSSVMGLTKRIDELLMRALTRQNGRQTRFTAVRFGNVLGSRGSVVPTFTRQIESGGPVTVTHPAMTRYFLSISEAVNLVIHAACLTEGDDLFMLEMGEEVRIVDLAERMIRMRGLRPYHDIDIVFTGVRPGEKLHEELRTALELPVATVHPGIHQLIGEADDFQAEEFLGRLSAFLSEGPDADGDLVARLQAVIGLPAARQMVEVAEYALSAK